MCNDYRVLGICSTVAVEIWQNKKCCCSWCGNGPVPCASLPHYCCNDALGQVISGQKYWSDGTAVTGEQFGYGFDTIGNRKSATANGNVGTYTANSLNEYTQRTVPGDVWTSGTASPNATVTVNLKSASRHDAYFAEGLSVNNTSSAVRTKGTKGSD